MIVRGAAIVLALLVLAPTLVVVRPLRERMLPLALGRLDAALPGTLHVQRARWPALGNLVLDGVRWSEADSETLVVAADAFEVDVGLRALWDRDLLLHRLTARGLQLDVPALRRLFAPDSEPGAAKASQRGFLRPGAVLGIPSLAVDTLRLEAPALQLGATRIEALQLDAELEARHGRVPRLRVQRAEATAGPDGWSVDSLALDVDLEHGKATGSGAGRVGPQWPVQLALTTAAPDRVVLEIAAAGAPAPPPAAMGVRTEIAIARRGLAVDSLVFAAAVRTPGTRDLARVPALATWLQDRPTVDGVQCTATGTLGFVPPMLRLGVTFVPGDLVQSGALALHRNQQAWELQCDSLSIADLRLRGTMRRGADSLVASTWLDVDGQRWRAWAGRALGPPWTLHARFDFRRRHQSSTAAVRLEGQADLAGHAIDRIALGGTLGIDAPSTLRLQLTSHGVDADIAAQIAPGETLRVRTSPLWLRVAGSAAASDPGALVSTLRRDRNTERITIDAMEIRGDAGAADFHCDFAPGAGGSLTARLAWPTLPALLARHFPATTADSLRAHWGPDAPFALEFAAAAGPDLDAVGGAGHFVLPGPRAFAGLAPGARVDDLGPLEGTLDFELTKDRRLDLQLDAARTTWIDTLRVAVRLSRDGIQIPTARIEFDSLRIDLTGALAATAVDLRAHYNLGDAALLRRVSTLDSLTARIETLELGGEARLHGRRSHPDFSADLAGRFAGYGVRVPALAIAVSRDTVGMRGRIDLAHGITTPWIGLERVGAGWTAGATWLPGQIELDAAGRGFSLHQSATVVSRAPWDITVAALRLALGDKDLTAVQPFRIAVDATRLRVDGLELSGSLGQVAAAGVASRDSTRCTAHVALDLQNPPECLVVRRQLWPRRVRFDLQAPHTDSLQAQLAIQGFDVAGSAEPELALDLRAVPQVLLAVTSLADTADIVRGTVTLPAHLQIWPLRATLGSGPVAADLHLSRLPVGLHTTRAPGAAADLGRVQGRVVLGGTADGIAAYTDLQLGFPDAPHLAPYTLAFRAHAGRDARADSLWRAAANDPTAVSEDLALAFTLLSGSTPLARGDASFPIRFAFARPFVRADSLGALAVHVRAEDVPLESCNPLLPRGAALHGKTTIVLDADGTLQDPRLDGRLTTTDVELVLGGGSRAKFVAGATLAGTRNRPVLRGELEVKTALVKVPETQKNLHPTSGAALLRSEVADTLVAAPESLATPPPPKEADPPPAALARSDLDIRIRVPRAFWVRGRGLDIEGKGDLQIAQQQGRPTVTGALQGIRGTFAIAGRTLTLDRATVDFEGGTDLNPKLAVQLSTDISGTKIRVLVSGTAAAPELTLSSDPEMEQSDIIALLALGKTYDQLSDEESGIMRERATAIVVSMGAAALQENVTQDLGIDVVQYRSNSGAPGAKSSDEANTGSLAFGKYLSPKVLLSYSYSLDRAVEDIVSLEYFLKGQLTLETLYSVKGQSGLGFGWTKEY